MCKIKNVIFKIRHGAKLHCVKIVKIILFMIFAKFDELLKQINLFLLFFAIKISITDNFSTHIILKFNQFII